MNNLLLQEVCVKKGNALPMNNLLLQEVSVKKGNALPIPLAPRSQC